MEDFAIVDLYWARDERAIAESDGKYGRMLSSLSYSLTGSHQDAEECVSDTYIAAWNGMPEDRPEFLGAYLSKIIRRILSESMQMLRAVYVPLKLSVEVPTGKQPLRL